MTNLTFIRYRKNFEHLGDFDKVFVTSQDIETLNVAETYDSYGQQIGHYYAGDYHFDNSDSLAIQDCNAALLEAGLINNTEEIEHSYNFHSGKVETELFGENELCDLEEIIEFVKDWREKNEVLKTCQGFNYWNGSNHKTILVSDEYNDSRVMYEIIDPEEVQEKGYNEALEKMEFRSNMGGYQTWESDNYFIVQSAFSSNPWTYEIEEKEPAN